MTNYSKYFIVLLLMYGDSCVLFKQNVQFLQLYMAKKVWLCNPTTFLGWVLFGCFLLCVVMRPFVNYESSADCCVGIAKSCIKAISFAPLMMIYYCCLIFLFLFLLPIIIQSCHFFATRGSSHSIIKPVLMFCSFLVDC